MLRLLRIVTDILAHHQYHKALEKARFYTKALGVLSSEAISAWEEVEERGQALSPRTNFQRYCDSNPSAAECKIYDV